MRRLVLSCLVVAAASQAAGCFITTEDDVGDEVGLITASWDFHTANGTRLDCPSGFDTAEVTVDSVNPGGDLVVDLYDCSDFAGTSEYFIDDYDVTIRITSPGGSNVYAESLTQAVDIVEVDGSVDEDFIDDGGRFVFDWKLVDAANPNTSLSCNAAGNPNAIEISSTLLGPNTLKTDKFDCSKGTGITAPLVEGNYTISVAALNQAGGPLGEAFSQDTTIEAPNGYTDLELITLPID
jgi:hypothetical protein